MPETYAYFYIQGFDCDPSTITDLLSIQPTQAWRRGDPHPRRKNHFFDISGWQVEAEVPRDGYDLGAPVAALVEKLLSVRERLVSLPPHKSKGINCVGYYFSENPGFHLTAELAGKISSLGLDVDFDLYNMRDSDELWFMRVPEAAHPAGTDNDGAAPHRV